MLRTAFFFTVLLANGIALAAVSWGPTGPTSAVQGSGDPTTAPGAVVVLSVEEPGPKGFGGAITAVDAGAYRGREVELAGSLGVTDGPGAAALWLRADGPDGRLAFQTTAGNPVGRDMGKQARSLTLYIPEAATSLKLGITLRGTGAVEADALTLRLLPLLPNRASAHDVLALAITTMQAHALNADRVQWPSERERLLTDDLARAPVQEAHVRIRKLIEALGDGHSTLRPADAATRSQGSANKPDSTGPDVSGGVGYLPVPGFRATDRAASDTFASGLCQTIARLAPEASNGWVIDLRHNGGGNMWPMLAGLRPLLGDAPPGAFKDRTGVVTPWQPGRLDACPGDLWRGRVAVLLGPGTASSGEAVAIAFKGRPGTRFFGRTTAGTATSNQGFPLPDGSVLLLTTAVLLDRDGAAYPRGVQPDGALDAQQDVVDVAAAWLRSTGP